MGCTMNRNLTLSMGAIMVLATTPAIPPEMKLLIDFDFVGCDSWFVIDYKLNYHIYDYFSSNRSTFSLVLPLIIEMFKCLVKFY